MMQVEFINNFKLYLKTQGRNHSQIRNITGRAKKYLAYAFDNDINIYALNIKGALSYQGYLCECVTDKGNAYDKRTVLSYMTASLVFYDYLKAFNYVYANPFREIKKVRSPKKILSNVLKPFDTDRLLDNIKTEYEAETDLKKKKTLYRVHVACELLYSTGMRINEAGSLKLEDIDFERGIVKVMNAKGGKPRVSFLNEYALRVLRLYIEKVRIYFFTEWNERNNDLLFGVKEGVIEKLVNRTLSQTGKKLNLKITCHGFRHAVGYHLLKSGCNIRFIQDILGHKKLRNTEIYTKVDASDLLSVIDKCHPRKTHENAMAC